MSLIIEDNNFNYTKLDKDTTRFLKQRENNISNINTDKYFNLGKELYEVRKRFSYESYVCFQEWYQSLGLKRQSVYNYINFFKLISQHNDRQGIIKNLPKKLAYEIARPKVNNKLREMVLSGDIATFKEYMEVKKENLYLQENVIKKIKDRINKYENQVKLFNIKISKIQKSEPNKNEDLSDGNSFLENIENPSVIYNSLDPKCCTLFKSYIDIYRSKNKTGRISKTRHLRLLKEIYGIYENKQFTFNGQTYNLSEVIFKKGLEIIINRGIDNLNYARKVWISKINNKNNQSIKSNNDPPEFTTNETETLNWMKEVNYLE